VHSTANIAELIGVHRDTILRWLRKGLIPEPKRDWRGWRVFTKQEADRILRFAKGTKPPTRVREAAATYTPVPTLTRLCGINWDFLDAKTIYLTHGLHPYPAKFIPQIPNALIQELSSVGESVADIFCGSGTTLVEALVLKRHAVGLDANPLACLISEAKTARVDGRDIEILNDTVQRALKMGNTVSLHSKGSLFGPSSFVSQAPRPADDAIGFWFDRFVIEEIAEALAWCRELDSEPSRKLALAALSAIIVVVSRQDSDTRYVRREKPVSPGDVFLKFAHALSATTRAASEFTDLVEPCYRCIVHNTNILTKPDIGQVDLVVCSPPYPNAFSYHLYHMTRMLWLGMNQKQFKIEEIGSHRKYSSNGSSRATIGTFRKEMETVFEWLRRTLKKSRHACFVVGNSTIKGEVVNNADLISSAAKKFGFLEVARISRNMLDSRKAFNPAIGKIKTEQILILQNEGGYGETDSMSDETLRAAV